MVVVVPSVVLECIFAPQYLRIFDDAYATKVRPLCDCCSPHCTAVP